MGAFPSPWESGGEPSSGHLPESSDPLAGRPLPHRPAPPFPARWTLRFVIIAMALIAAACGTRSATETAASDSDPGSPSAVVPEVGASSPTPEPSPTPTPRPVQAFGTPAGSALDLPAVSHDGPEPVAMRFTGIGVELARVESVGVESSGEMEIPGADAVGWYSYGPAPGEQGSAVLAGHIAFEGVDGVFRDLEGARIADAFTVYFDDGSEQEYRIVERAQYEKSALPVDRVFGREGDPVVTLISCGGDFQPSLRSYQDNVVAYAVPVAPKDDAR